MNKSIKESPGAWHPLILLLIGLMFSFLPAGILFALNNTRLGRHRQKNIDLIFTIVLFVILLSISFLFGDNKFVKLVIIITAILYPLYLFKDQIKIYKDYIKNDGLKGSYLKTIPVILISIATIVILLVSIGKIELEYDVYQMNKSVNLLKQSKFLEAEIIVNKLRNKYPDKPFPYMSSISIYENTNRIDEAIRMSKYLKIKFPDDQEVIDFVNEFNEDYSRSTK